MNLGLIIGILVNQVYCRTKDIFVVQTDDNKLHFITDRIETHSLPYSLEIRKIDQKPLLNLPGGVLKPLQPSSQNNMNSVAKVNRIDEIFISKDGFIKIFGKEFFIDDLLLSPLVHDGIYISASQEHKPTIINNTVVISAKTKISLIDLFFYDSKTLEFCQILYLFETYIDIPRRENSIFINSKWWNFNYKITSLFILKEKDGLNFMAKVVNKTEIARYRSINRRKTGTSRYMSYRALFSVVFILGVTFLFYLRRNITYYECIIKDKLFLGRFIKNSCLIYHVNQGFLREFMKKYGKFKNGNVVNIFYENSSINKSVIITEMTSQFNMLPHSLTTGEHESYTKIPAESAQMFFKENEIDEIEKVEGVNKEPEIDNLRSPIKEKIGEFESEVANTSMGKGSPYNRGNRYIFNNSGGKKNSQKYFDQSERESFSPTKNKSCNRFNKNSKSFLNKHSDLLVDYEESPSDAFYMQSAYNNLKRQSSPYRDSCPHSNRVPSPGLLPDNYVRNSPGQYGGNNDYKDSTSSNEADNVETPINYNYVDTNEAKNSLFNTGWDRSLKSPSSNSARTDFRDKFAFLPTEVTEKAIKEFKSKLLVIVESFEGLHKAGSFSSRICPENIRWDDNGNIKVQILFQNTGWRSRKQLRNLKSKDYLATQADDIFSLGCLLHYYLTGYHPFDLRDYVKKDRKSGIKNGERNKISNSLHLTVDEESDNSNSSKNANEQSYKRKSPTRSNGYNLPTSKSYKSEDTNYDCIEEENEIYNHSILYRRIFKFLDTVPINTFCSWILKIGRCVRCLFIKKSVQTLPNIYKKILSDEAAKYIEYNVLFNTYRIRLDDQVEHDLIYHTLKNPESIPELNLSLHPFFWDSFKCLEFICDISDLIETNVGIKQRLEKSRKVVFRKSWVSQLDPLLVKTVSERRAYDFHSLCDLIRFIRNCHRHFIEIKSRTLLEALDGRLFHYFSYTFPELLMFLYNNPAFKDQPALKKYYSKN